MPPIVISYNSVDLWPGLLVAIFTLVVLPFDKAVTFAVTVNLINLGLVLCQYRRLNQKQIDHFWYLHMEWIILGLFGYVGVTLIAPHWLSTLAIVWSMQFHFLYLVVLHEHDDYNHAFQQQQQEEDEEDKYKDEEDADEDEHEDETHDREDADDEHEEEEENGKDDADENADDDGDEKNAQEEDGLDGEDEKDEKNDTLLDIRKQLTRPPTPPPICSVLYTRPTSIVPFKPTPLEDHHRHRHRLPIFERFSSSPEDVLLTQDVLPTQDDPNVGTVPLEQSLGQAPDN